MSLDPRDSQIHILLINKDSLSLSLTLSFSLSLFFVSLANQQK